MTYPSHISIFCTVTHDLDNESEGKGTAEGEKRRRTPSRSPDVPKTRKSVCGTWELKENDRKRVLHYCVLVSPVSQMLSGGAQRKKRSQLDKWRAKEGTFQYPGTYDVCFRITARSRL